MRELLLFTVLNKGPRPQTRPSRSHHNSRPHYCLAVERRNSGSGSNSSGSNSSSNRLTALRVVPASHGSHPYNTLTSPVPHAEKLRPSTASSPGPPLLENAPAATAQRTTVLTSLFYHWPVRSTLYLRTLFLFCCASLPRPFRPFPFASNPPQPSPLQPRTRDEPATSRPGLSLWLALLACFAFLCFPLLRFAFSLSSPHDTPSPSTSKSHSFGSSIRRPGAPTAYRDSGSFWLVGARIFVCRQRPEVERRSTAREQFQAARG